MGQAPFPCWFYAYARRAAEMQAQAREKLCFAG